MAKIHEEVLVLKLSKIIKDKNQEDVYLADTDFCSSVEQVVQELLGDSIVVELERVE